MRITSELLKEIGFELMNDHGHGCGEWKLTISEKENITIWRYDENDNQFVLNETGLDDGNRHYQVKTLADLLIAINKSSIFYGKKLKHKSILEFIKTEEIKEYCQRTGSKSEKELIEWMKEKEGLE